MRQDAPAGELRRVAGLPGIEEHESKSEAFRYTEGGLQGEMGLVLGGEQRSIAHAGSLGFHVQVSFKAVLAAPERLVLVNMDLKRILRRHS